MDFHLQYISMVFETFLLYGSSLVKLSPVEYLTVEYSPFKKFEKTIITVNWDFSHTPKQVYK